jgi:serine protease AprX
MKKIITLSLVALISLTFFLASKQKIDKFGPRLKYAVENSTNTQYSVYIYLNDKGPNAEAMLNNPLNLVTQRSLDRRVKVMPAGHLVDMSDIPLYAPYKNEVGTKVLKIRQEIKWFNAVTADVNASQLYDISNLNYVSKIELIEKFIKNNDNVESNPGDGIINQTYQTDQPNVDTLNYGTGSALSQITQIKVNLVHDIGVYGQNVMVANFDNGWKYQNHESFTTLPMNVYRQYDFQLHIPNAYSVGSNTTHGTNTLSLVGGYKPGKLIGPAFKSIFLVARTEVDTFERPVEMDNWVAAAQWADSLGADVITSSLGYLEFDAGYSGYTYLDMNGRTLPVTLAAALAARHGIVVCNSAGNNYHSGSVNTLNGPADADSIITVGAVSSSGTIASFSSQGPTTDNPPRIKPDVCAMGSNNYVAQSGTTTYQNGDGTSYSCPITAGVAALVLCANKNLTPIQVRGILRYFASNHLSPNNIYGWGTIDAQQSVDSARKLDNVYPTINHTQPFTTTTNTGVITLKARVFDNGIIRYSRSTEAPRVYFRKSTNSGANWTAYSSANYTNNTTRDTFYFQITGSTAGTRVEYYLAVQDIALPSAFGVTLPVGGGGINPPGYNAPPTRFTYNVTSPTSIISNETPAEYKLFDNYPNPFNPVTKIRFRIKETGFVTLKVYDITGKLVITLVNQKMQSGDYNVDFDGRDLSSGLYIYKIESGDFKDTKKMLMIK